MTDRVDRFPFGEPEPARIIEWLRRHLPVTARVLSDSRQVRAGDVFVALPGARVNGGAFAAQAVAQGAAAVLYEMLPPGHPFENDGHGPDIMLPGTHGLEQAPTAQAFPERVSDTPQDDAATGVPRASVGHARVERGLFLADMNFGGKRVPGCVIPHLSAVLGPVADGWYRHPSRALTVMAVTGTNGKTSVSHWIADAINGAARNAASQEKAEPEPAVVIGTSGAGVPGTLQPVGLTTPGALDLQRLFHEFAGEGRKLVAMEASSIGIEQGRLDGTTLHTAIFTNFTRDHLDYHGSMPAYAEAKTRLFVWPGLQHAVVNLDDRLASTLVDVVRRHKGRPQLIGYHLIDEGVAVDAGVQAHIARCDAVFSATPLADGRVRFALRQQAGAPHETATQQSAPVRLAVIGRFNLSNVLAVAGALHAGGLAFDDIVVRLQTLSPVPGRMEMIRVPDAADAAQATLPQVVVDYAHTPDALTNVLGALRSMADTRGGRLWCIFGAGGDRDRGKRPAMAAAVDVLADHVVVTSDNPRSEDPQQILDDVVAGLSRPAWRAEPDRAGAIAAVIDAAAPADVVLVAGKGRERTQEIAGVFHPFSDPDVVARALGRRLQQGASAEASHA